MGTGGRFSSKSAVRAAFDELRESRETRSACFRNGAAQLVKLLGEIAAFVSLHKWEAAQWLEGDLHAEIAPAARGVTVRVCSNMGYGLCDAVFPAIAYETITLDEIRWVLGTVPELAGPLHWWSDAGRVVLGLPDERVRITSVPFVSAPDSSAAPW